MPRFAAILMSVALALCGLAQAQQTESSVLSDLAASPEPYIEWQPTAERRSFNLTGDTRSIYNAIGTAFGIQMQFDQALQSRQARFELADVNFETAVDVAGQLTKTFAVPLAPRRALVANATQEKRREFNRMVHRTFYLRDLTTAQELTETANLLRTMFELRYVLPQPQSSTIEVRGPRDTVKAVERFLAAMDASRPEVALDVQIFEVNRSMLKTVGVDLPLQFQVFNITTAVQDLLNSPNIQDLINQLISSGGLTPENLGSLAGLIGQLQNQQSSLLANPLATFGGGLTLFAIGIPPATANLSLNESRVQLVQRVQLRASQANAANLHVGTRFPVLTQSFSSGLTIPGLPGGDLSNATGLIPGFQYEDLGVTLKATPVIHGTSRVSLKLELSVKSLGGEVFNGVPVIQNRQYQGSILVENGHSTVLTGMISENESKTLRGLPVVSRIPILGRATSVERDQQQMSELLVVITPNIVRARERSTDLIELPAAGQ